METKKLGTANVDAPVIGMGTWKLGGMFTPDYRHDQEAISSLKAGIELGLTLIDTAEMYGAGHSEELVAKAVKGLRQRVFIVSKVLPENLSYREVSRAAERSLRRLETDYIDLYLVHEPNSSVPIAETMRAMEELVDQGKARFIGVSNFSVRQLRQAQECLSRHQLVSNQMEYHLLDRAIEEDLLPLAEKERLNIMAYSPFATGYLLHYSGKGRKTLENLASKYNKTFPQICLNWLISREPVIAIPKAINVDHLKENAGAAGWRMEPGDYAVIDKVFI